MKPLNVTQISLYGSKGAGNQSSVLMWTCTMTNNLSIEQIDEHTNVVPPILDFHIGQIADDKAFDFSLLKLTIQYIRCCRFITSRFMRLILGYGIRGNQALLFHDPANAASGHDEALFLELDFDLSRAVGFSILVENLHNRFYELIFFSLFFRFVIECTSCHLQDVTHC
ncbi:hypothetical protein D1872_218520 [compost metagenome]